MQTAMTELEQRCIEAGLKMTGQRRIILQVLESSADHPSVETVFQRARDIDSTISIATVYRTLQLLNDKELVQRHAFNDESHARFEANLEHHHHLIDLDTGEVIEFQHEGLERLKQQIAAELGYELIDHRLELYGHKKKTR
jgi:Fur family ferric uptake transcriptional regulator